MKIGFNLPLWTTNVQSEHWPILEDIKRVGYDSVEIPVFEGAPAQYAELHFSGEGPTATSASARSTSIGPTARALANMGSRSPSKRSTGSNAIKALKRSGYEGWLTIEAFGRALPELAAATRVWRDLFPAPSQVYREGYSVIREGWDAA